MDRRLDVPASCVSPATLSLATGKPANTLDELVRSTPHVHPLTHSTKAVYYGYGEVFVGLGPVAPGQGVLWSVGHDRNDDGGQRQGFGAGDDLVFPVPLPPKK